MSATTLENQDYKEEIRQKTSMPLMWIAIVSMVMLFAALTSAIVVSKGSRDWVSIELPGTFLLSTIIIVVSSLTYMWAFSSAKKDDIANLKNGIFLTLLLGISFAVCQFYSWNQLVDQGIFFAGNQSTVSGSFLYVVSGVHLAHMVGGLISLIVVYIKSIRGKYNSNNLLGLQVSSTFWHFLGGLWVYLYLFLKFIAL